MDRKLYGLAAATTALATLVLGSVQSAPAFANNEEVTEYLSSQNGAYTNSQQAPLTINTPASSSDPKISVDFSKMYQTMQGMGTALDLTTIANLQSMDSTHRSDVLNKLFNPVTGAGIAMLRVQFGNSDFNGNSAWYSYDDMPPGQTDASLLNFSIQKDFDNGNIDMIRAALAVNPALKVFASVWSPPGWMKDNDSLFPGTSSGPNRGFMLTQYVTTYATYIRKAVEAYQAQGIPIYALIPQNEPEYCNNTYPQACWSQSQLASAVNGIKSEFSTHGIGTQVWYGEAGFGTFDSLYASSMKDATTRANTSALAFHPYSGNPSQMNTAHYQTGLPVYMTEKAQNYIQEPLEITNYFRNSASLDSWWVSIADETGGPSNGPFKGYFGGSDAETLVQTSSANANSYCLTYSYEFFKQFSKYMRPGARRIYTDEGTSTLKTVGFRNPDGQVVVVATNSATGAQPFRLETPTGEIATSLPSNSVATYLWYPQNLAQNGGFESGFGPWVINAGNAGVETSYPQAGLADGFLHPASGAPAKMSQSFTAPSSGYFTIDAYAATSNGVTATLAADVNGTPAATTAVSGGVYTEYSLVVRANAGATINVRYETPATAAGSWATVDSVYVAKGSSNLLANPGFETNDLTGWSASAIGTGVETSFPNSGGYDAYLHPTSAGVGVAQIVTAPASGTYTYSAFVATNIGSGVSIGADVNGTTVATAGVNSSTMGKFTVSFTATAGQSINVWLYGPPTVAGNWAAVDDAMLSF